MTKMIFNIITAFLLCTPVVYAQPGEIQWQRTLGGDKNDDLVKVVSTKDGGYVAAGTSYSGITGLKTDTSRGGSDYWVVKLDDTGAIAWQRTLGGNNNDLITDVIATNDGGCLLGGTSQSSLSGDRTEASRGMGDLWIVKLNSAGIIEWQKALGGTSNDYKPYLWQSPVDSGYFIGGTSSSPISGEKSEMPRGNLSNDYWVVKLDKNGNKKWDKTIGSNDFTDDLTGVLGLVENGYLVYGMTTAKASGDKTDTARGGFDYWIVRIDDTGRILWDKTIGTDATDRLIEIKQTRDGGFIVGGQTNGNISFEKSEPARGGYDYWLIKLDQNGDMSNGWQRTIGGNYNDMLASVEIEDDGSYLIGGYSSSLISGENTEPVRGGDDYWLMRVGEAGHILWQRKYGDAYNGIPLNSILDVCTSFGIALDGGYIAGGYSYTNPGILIAEKNEPGFGERDFWIIKLKACNDTLSVPTPSICKGNAYPLPWGDTAKREGIYYHKYYSIQGCDSTSSIEVKMVDIDTSVTTMAGALKANATNATFQWIDCSTNQSVAGATKATFKPAKDGTYSVAINKYGCTATSGCHAIISLGMKTILPGNDNVTIYPNPAKGNVSFKYNIHDIQPGAMLTITDITGKIVQEFSIAVKQGVIEWNAHTLSAGMYLYRLNSGSGTYTGKLIIEQ